MQNGMTQESVTRKGASTTYWIAINFHAENRLENDGAGDDATKPEAAKGTLVVVDKRRYLQVEVA